MLLLGTTRGVSPRSRVSAPRCRPRAPWWHRDSRTRRCPMIATSAWHDALSHTARRVPTATRPRPTPMVLSPPRSFSTTIALRMPRSGMGASSTTRYPVSRSRGCSPEQREHGYREPGAQGDPHELYFIVFRTVCGAWRRLLGTIQSPAWPPPPWPLPPSHSPLPVRTPRAPASCTPSRQSVA